MENIGPSLRSLVPESTAHSLSSLRDLFDVQEVDTPFVGLRPFEIADGPLFFGRREQTDELLQRLHRTRFVAVVGGSGCGKSSLVRAGLIPALQAGFLVADRDTWANFTMKPGDQPLRNLAAALPQGDAKPVSLDDTAAGIRMFGVNAVLDRLQPLILKGSNILLVVDQFEETFRFGLEGDEDRREEAADFISILLALVQKPELPIYVVLTMRSDFMGDCDVFPGLADAMNRSLYLVPRLTRQQRREAIEGPIRMAGAAISPRLLDLLLNESDMASDQLPVLQHALMRTWEEWRKDEDALAAQPSNGNGGPCPAGILGRPLRQPEIGIDHYERAGTLKNALNRHAEEALEGLDLDVTRKIFQALTDVDVANRQIRRPARLSVLGKVAGGTEEAVTRVLRRFQSDGRCFVVWASPEGHPDPLIDLSHESLIRCWKRLGKWVEEEAESAAVYRRLETATVRRQRGGDLWRDTDLQQALDWQVAHQVGPDWAARVRASEVFRKPDWKRPSFQQVLEFLEKSRAARDEERQREEAKARELLLAANRQTWFRRMKAISAVAAVLAIVALAFVGLAFSQMLSMRDVNLSSRLTRQSGELAATNPQLALLLAIEALNIAPQNFKNTKEPENALRAALALLGGQGLGAHYRGISSLTVSSDGRWLVSGGLDGGARSWDLLKPQPEMGSAAILEGDGKSQIDRGVYVAAVQGRIAIGGADGKIILRHQGEAGDLVLKGPGPEISALAFHAGGRWLVAGDAAGDVWLWELTGLEARQIHFPRKLHQNRIVAAEVSRDGRWLVTVSNSDRMVLWRLDTVRPPLALIDEPKVSAVDLNGDWLVSGSFNGTWGTVRLWCLTPDQPREDLNARLTKGPIHAIAVGPAGGRIVTASIEVGPTSGKVATASNELMQLWHIKSNQPSVLLSKPNTRDVVTDLAISPEGNWLAAAYNSGSVRLWQPGSWRAGHELLLRGHGGPVKKVIFSPKSYWLFTGGSDGTVRRWDLSAPDPSSGEIRLRGGWGDPRATWVTTLSPNLQWLVVGGQAGGKLCSLKASRGGGCQTIPEHDLSIVKVSGDSRWLATGQGGRPFERSLRLREIGTGMGDGEALADVTAVEFGSDPNHPADTWLITGQKSSGAIWIRKSGAGGFLSQPFLTLPGHKERVDKMAITPDRRHLVVTRALGTVQLWRLEGRRGRQLFPPSWEKMGDSKIAMSSDSRWLAIAAASNTTSIWGLTAQDTLKSPMKILNKLKITQIGFGSKDQLFLGFEDGTTRSYELPSESEKPLKPSRIFDGHRDGITSLTVSRNGRYLATGGEDGTTRVWDLTDPRSSSTVMPWVSRSAETSLPLPIVNLAFNDDDQDLLTVVRDGTVRRWHLAEDELRREARVAVGRNMYERDWCEQIFKWSRSPGQFLIPRRSYQVTFEDLPPLQPDGSCRSSDLGEE